MTRDSSSNQPAARLSLDHIALDPVEPIGSAPRHAIIMLHGYGANERDLLPLGHALSPSLLVICPRAPIDLAPFGMFGSNAWFHVRQDSGARLSFDESGAADAITVVKQFLDEAIAHYQLQPEHLWLMGFSQGAMLVHSILCSQHLTPAGAIACSGWLPKELHPAADAPDAQLPAMAGVRLFVGHGTHDELIPIDAGHAVRDFYQHTKIDLTYREYPISHGINDTELEDMRAWMHQRR